MEAAPDAVFVIQENRCAYVNPAGCQLLDESIDTLLGAPALEYVHPAYRKRTGHRLHRRLLEVPDDRRP